VNATREILIVSPFVTKKRTLQIACYLIGKSIEQLPLTKYKMIRISSSQQNMMVKVLSCQLFSMNERSCRINFKIKISLKPKNQHSTELALSK